jgi:ABC-type sugar transport system ATPase subunit
MRRSHSTARRRLDEQGIAPLEHELTMHLERAHELAERAQKANGNAQQEIERARAIANELNEHVRRR